MVTHIVSFKLKDKNPETITKLVTMLLGLRGKVPTLKSMEAGADFVKSERSYDLALIAKFDDKAGLDAYQVHPEHLEVAKFIGTVREAAVAVDFES